MKTVVCIFGILLSACAPKGGGDAASLVASPAPVADTLPLSGVTEYDRDVAAAGYAPCPYCVHACTDDGSSCSYTSYLLPPACTMEIIGGLRVNAALDKVETFGLTLPGTGGAVHGIPHINWSGDIFTPTDLTISGSAITFNSESYTINIVSEDATAAIVNFAPGCTIKYLKTTIADF